MTGRLDPESRQRALAQLTGEELDVLVVGGGAVGAGAALDAVSRGLRVGLVEADDWGSRGSGHTPMLVNASWRDVSAPDPVELRAALRERAMLLDWLAPHLVHRVPFLYPLTGGPGHRLAIGAEVLLYDAMARSVRADAALPAHRHLGRRATRRLVPALRAEAVTGGVQFYEAETDDARLVLTLARTADAYGAAVASQLEVTGLLRDGDRVRGARLVDRTTDQTYEVFSRVVLLTTGRGLDGSPLGGAGQEPPPVPGRRVHLVVPRAAIRSSTGIVLPGEGRDLLRITPWGRLWLVGPVAGDDGPAPDPAGPDPAGPDPAGQDDWPRATAADVGRLLASVNGHLSAPLRPDQVQGCWVGLATDRPRTHHPDRPAPGLVVAAEARLSTYRLVAAQAVDTVARELGGLVAPSITERLPLLGADGYHARWNQRHLLARRAGLHVARVEHLLNRYGSAADDLLSRATRRPELARPVPGAEDYLQVEVGYAASHEGATRLVDVLARRTRISLDTVDGGHRAAAAVADLVGDELGWDPGERLRQVEAYRVWLGRERQALGPAGGSDG